MRIVTEEGQQGYVNATINGGLRGAALAAAICTPSYYLLRSRSATYRALPIPLKALGLVVISVPCISISAEKAGEAYERSLWTGVGQRELLRQGEVAEQRWEELSTGEKIKNWANRNQYGIVGGSWAASMAAAFGIVARNKYASLPQKIVQARMWAQGLTVGVLIVSAVMAGVNSQGEKPAEPEDHSWRDILEEQEAERKEREGRGAVAA